MVPVDPDLGSRRDPEFIRANLDKLAFYVHRFHHTTVEGLDNIPDGAALAVGNHNGGIMSPDMYALMVAWWRHFGVDTPSYGLAHDIGLKVPVFRDLLARVGGVPARPENAVALLQRGHKVLVYPGGDLDAYRPASRRNEIVFGERRGFVRVALRAQAPIVPVVSAGAHDAFHVLTDGRCILRRLGIQRLARVEVLPIALCIPWGIQFGPGLYLPWPVRMRIRVLAPIAWPALAPEAADDDSIVRRCRDEVVEVMQSALTSLAREGGTGRRTLIGP